MEKRLVVGDVDQIQSYVFGSARLRAIRGASALLENAVEEFKVEEEKRYNVRVEFLRHRGGQVIVVLDFVDAENGGKQQSLEKESDEFCARLEARARSKTGGAATITTTHVPYNGKGFRDALKGAFRAIHKEKDGRQMFGVKGEALLTSPYYHRCDLLPTQPAGRWTRIDDFGEEERYLSNAADASLEEAKSGKNELDQSLLRQLDASLMKNGYELPHQPDDLWDGEGGYMGYVAADGNGIGQMLEVIDDQELYKNFSEKMNDLVIAAIAMAAKDVKISEKGFPKTKRSKRGKRAKSYKFVPLAPVIIAGDDMSLLVRASHALEFAECLCYRFAEESRSDEHIQEVIKIFCHDPNYMAAARRIFSDSFLSNGQIKPDTDGVWKAGQPLTLSVGVAIAKRKFPISVYRRLAGELRDEAKRALREKGTDAAREKGMINFAVITTATAQSLEDLRRSYHLDTTTRLTLRPYTHAKFEKLRALAKSLKKLPRSKRKFIYTELFAGRATGEAAYKFVIGRELRERQEKISKAMKDDFKCESGAAFGNYDVNKQATPLVDALEIAEIMSEED